MQKNIDQFIVTAAQMRQIEERIFAQGMPVPALMEKVAGLITQRLRHLLDTRYPHAQKIGVLVGPGHNGGDALVVARELYFQGYDLILYQPLARLKELTGNHAQYAYSLGIPRVDQINALEACDLIVDGLFGFGLEREITGIIADAINTINQWQKPMISIDIPSGIHTDTGAVLGTAIQATHTFCLGLWKLAFVQDQALAFLGVSELIDFDIPVSDIIAILGKNSKIQRITSTTALSYLPLPRHPVSHKYTNGHLLLIAGSQRYSGAAILAGLGARATGVGMLSIAVPESLKPMLTAQLPEALIIGCPETDHGAIHQLPVETDLSRYDTIACGPGLTLQAAAVVETALESSCVLVLDADGLNVLSHLGSVSMLANRATTVITPHSGEFKRLFPELSEEKNRVLAVEKASEISGAIVVFKGARVVIGQSQDQTGTKIWVNPESTPALARGGSGDVLTGLMGGLLAGSSGGEQIGAVQTAVWWHAQAGMLAAQECTELGVDAFTLTQYLVPGLKNCLDKSRGINQVSFDI